jgi:hypothetical protein
MVAITAPAPASPKLCKALQDAKQAGQTYVIIDGTLCPSTGWPPAGHLLWQAPPWHEQGHGHPAPGTSG